MSATAEKWIDWWNEETVLQHDTWHNNMEIFVRETTPLLNYGSEDVMLDIGSGPGYLAAFLKDCVREIHCLETSERYLQMCRSRFETEQNVFAYELDRTNYTSLAAVKGKRFDKIICQSVVQYYQAQSDVSDLIREVQAIAAPGAQFLISDIPTANSQILNAYELLKTSIKEGMLMEKIKMAASAAKTGYSKIKKLTFSDDDLRQIVSGVDAEAEILTQRLTCNDGRRHILIRF